MCRLRGTGSSKMQSFGGQASILQPAHSTFSNSNIEVFHKASPVFVAPLHATPSTDSSGRNDLLNGNYMCYVSKVQDLFSFLHVLRIKVMSVSKRHCLWAMSAKVCIICT